MDTHKNAHLTPKGREDMVRAVVDGGLSSAAAARKFNTTPKTVAKWVKRFRAEGVDGLSDRSSRPLSSDNQTPQATCDAIEVLRRQRHTGKQIAAEVEASDDIRVLVIEGTGRAFCAGGDLQTIGAAIAADNIAPVVGEMLHHHHAFIAALRDRRTFPERSSMPTHLIQIMSPIFTTSSVRRTRKSASSEMWTRPSLPGVHSTKQPKSLMPVTRPW